MEQQGYIIEILDKNTAKLKMQRHSACAACGKCVTSSESKDIVVEVDNNIGAKVGDRVKVNMDGVNVLKAAFLVYITPLAGLLIGTIVTYFILNSISITSSIEVISFIAGITTMMIAFFILKKRDKKFRESREYIPIITDIVSSGKDISL